LPAHEGYSSTLRLVEAYFIRVPVASLNDLIAMKRAAGRPKGAPKLAELFELKDLTKS
jgi:hypothetical protein